MPWEYIVMAIVVIHFIIGFGWLFYKLEIEKNHPDNM
jgi:hypothetical protein